MKKNKLIAISIGAIFLLPSCTPNVPSSNASSESSSKSSKSESYSSSKKEEWDTNYSDKNVAKNCEANKNIALTSLDYNTPTIGTQPILVIPIIFDDKTFTNSELNEIKVLTSGESSETKYWESLGSYYKKSSYGKLNLQFTYAEPVSMGMDAEELYDKYGASGSSVALKRGVKAYKAKNGADSTKKFDLDGDGFIDSVIMIYAEKEMPSYDPRGELYWAFRYWDNYEDEGITLGRPAGDVSSPVGNSYFWSSLNFFYEATGTRENHTGIDAHTLTHEFGHMLGADDYYNIDDDPKSEPAGGKLMMANNVLDHDAFNKFQFNWVKPTYVSGSAEVTIHSFEETGEFILLSDKGGWNETAFDEYVLVELFTPTGLNELDSKTPYSQYSSTGYDKAGIRIWHVDNRLAKMDETGTTLDYYSDTEVKEGNFGEYYPIVACNNSSEKDTEVAKGKGFDSLTLISAKGNTFSNRHFSKDEDLFHEGDSFSLCESTSSKFNKYFANSNHLNNGNDFPFKIEVSSLNDSEAKIKITEHI